MPVAVNPSEASVDIRGLWKMLWRRKWMLVIPAILGVLAALLIIVPLPYKYRSEAILLVQDPTIREDLVPSLNQEGVDRQIDTLRREILLEHNLLEIINRHELYPDQQTSMSPGRLAENMRQDIDIVRLRTDVTDPTFGRTVEATVAFTVEYTYSDPELARQVTNDLTSLFISKNINQKRRGAETTRDFFANERAALERRITEIEENIAEFRTNNQEFLPEEIAFSRQLVVNIEDDLAALERELRALKERQSFLQTQLSLTDEFVRPDGDEGETPELLLETRLAELATAQARYSANHPDVQRLRNEVRSLQAVVGQRSGGGQGPLVAQEAALAAELGTLRERYTAEHPDVVRAERELANVRRALAEGGAAGGRPPGGAFRRDPAYVELKAQLNSVESEISSAEQRRAELQQQRTELQRRLAKAPTVQKEYERLNRDLENALAERSVLSEKEVSAGLSRSLELDAAGARFILAQPPSLPEFPVSPNKKLLLALGLFFSLGGGGLVAVVAEFMDRSIRSGADLARLIGDQPLAQIPDITTAMDRRRMWFRRAAVAGALVLVLPLAGLLLHQTKSMPLATFGFGGHGEAPASVE